MRFEIGTGGMLLVLVGLAGLSAAVFGLGLVAGHELAGPESGSEPVAAAYPLPPAAGTAPASQANAAAPAPVASAEGPAAASAEPETAGAGDAEVAPNAAASPASHAAVASKGSAAASAQHAGGGAVRRTISASAAAAAGGSRAASASDQDLSTGAAVAPPSEAGSEPERSADTGDDEGEEESAPAAPVKPAPKRLAAINNPPHLASGPYSVQIDAVMDLAGAEKMAQRIRAKGFEAYLVPTQVQGKTWYRLRVGHYATPEQAQAAESKLHQDFNDTSAGN
jgi:septal ring-binding cell division protein DamX